jgi:hypothetical protein
MAGTPVNGADADLAALDEGLPAIQAFAEAAVLQQLIGVFLTDIAKATLPGDGWWLEEQ